MWPLKRPWQCQSYNGEDKKPPLEAEVGRRQVYAMPQINIWPRYPGEMIRDIHCSKTI
jgi:hypothetical protein